MVDMWKRSSEEFIPFLDFPAEVRRLIHTTSCHARQQSNTDQQISFRNR
jgi:transposase-like protein